MTQRPADDASDGPDETGNVVMRQSGEPPRPSFEPKPHWELGESLGIIDFERGTKLGGSRFYVLRGAGARLVDERGTPFMERYDPEWKDLAPRDVVSRNIHSEILRLGVSNVYLDLRSYIPAERIRAEFPEMHRGCLEYGIDITRDLLPVVPAAHYSCGGVWADDHGQSTVGRLYAIGEVSCTGLHGANRLASTSLLEGLVWGHRAARRIAEVLESNNGPRFDDVPPEAARDPEMVRRCYEHVERVMQAMLDSLAAERRFPVLG